MGLDYTQQKLWEAMRALAGPGSLPERLRSAMQSLQQAHLPAFPSYPELEERFARLLQWADSIDALNDASAQVMTTEILTLFTKATELATYPVQPDALIKPEDLT